MVFHETAAENQPEILIHGKTAYEDDARLDTVIVPVHGVFVRGLGEPVPGQKVHQRIQHRPDDFGEEIRPFGFVFFFFLPESSSAASACP